MIAELGAFALALALALSILQTGLSAAGRARRCPVLAGAAMALSSVSVLFNALLLKRWRLKRS